MDPTMTTGEKVPGYENVPEVKAVNIRATRESVYGAPVPGRVTAYARYGIIPGSQGPDWFFQPDDGGRGLWWAGSLITLEFAS